MIERVSIDETLMHIAFLWADRATCTARVKVGAVLVDSHNRIIAAGYNGSPRGFPHCTDVGCITDSDGHCLRAIHAEENAILQCAAMGVSTEGLRLFVTHSPCIRCTPRIIQAGIASVVYCEQYASAKHFILVKEMYQQAKIPFTLYK